MIVFYEQMVKGGTVAESSGGKSSGVPTADLARKLASALSLEEARGREVRLARAEFLPTVSAEASYEVNQARAFGDGQGKDDERLFQITQIVIERILG